MRSLLTLSAALSAACLLSLLLPQRSIVALGLVSLLFFLLLRFLPVRSQRPRRLLYLSFGLALGFLCFALHNGILYLPSQVLADKTIRLEAVVTQYPSQTDYGIRVPVRGGEAGAQHFSMQLYLPTDFAHLQPGDRIETVAYCSSTETQRGQESFSLRSKGIFLFARSYGEVTHLPAAGLSLRFAPQHFGHWLRQKIDALYAPEVASLLQALLTGRQDALSDSDRADFSRTGLSHVVSVSGMHISFLAGILQLFLRRGGAKSATLQILLVFFFAFMTGAAPGALRAAFLCSSALLAPLFRRRPDAITALFAALSLLLLQNPFAIAHLGLQFSFAATLGIYLLGQPLYRNLEPHLPTRGRRILAVPLSLLSITLGAIVFTTPLSALYFSQVSLIAPLSNLLTNSLISLGFLGGLLSVFAAALFAPLGLLLASLTSLPLQLFLFLARSLSKLPFAALETNSFYFALFFVFVYIIGLAALYWHLRGQRRHLISVCCCVSALCLSVLLNNVETLREDLQLRVLDVGQGQSIALSSGTYRALIDCGGTRQAGSIASNHFLSLGQKRLDLLLLTHYHDDHANGLRELFAKLDIGTLAIPSTGVDEPWHLELRTLAEAQGTVIWYIDEETEIPFGRASLHVFPPLSRIGDNEAGLSLLCQSGDFSALITGDMGEETEAQLLARYPIPALDLLILGHHGSRYANSEALLLATTPQYAIASVGLGNTYGHPASETLARLAAQETTLYRTDALGGITVRAPRMEDTDHATESQSQHD